MTTGGIDMEEHDDEPTFEEPFKAQMERLDAEDEARAATEAALQAERDLNDEAASQDDGHDAEREELHDNGLVWWRDKSLIDAHRAMSDLFEEALQDFDSAKVLIEHGLSEETMLVEQRLTLVTGPLVICGLQLLGLFVPEFRETIAQLLKDFPFPVATPEEEAAIDAAVQAANLAAAQKFRAMLAQAQAEEQDAGLDLPEGDAGPNFGGVSLN